MTRCRVVMTPYGPECERASLLGPCWLRHAVGRLWWWWRGLPYREWEPGPKPDAGDFM